ncbi:single-stranded-DNA-specific exonuclease RecJ [Campylobacter sp. RM9344]|uniref:Single-stranded-DNA-specific exonuclease RecJ n=1 Tax=Campylobacter californiensis TaxID=1032243 RepID=A0AAW3ZXQ2_9BACT|nr:MULTISPECIES: single-stranded-DNA-specific exonuclease RecJ [unclassified Campylobacter]MBE2985034.1 single-stranded-DNA-specific exonuclease RecJ [Campylobacter sp. RM6883]MBE2986736.1 single-stranded-DNA-specific exonuclease RecJ [Campylobacter sp. RM12919]MBE2988470.1 single-stranded-DNA-specific exonuclease RecJ [Campylobacter sp. RM12920]MBE2995230.1 single-stranded-DNA-specific exonuclease RecJ [Campylobacter sp. RM6913]MBE3029513.1 single-stranded-DNA-specific exonuclease RecJ [Campy
MLSKEEIRNLLELRFSKDIHKKLSEIPTPSVLKDIFKGATRIKEAIEREEHIVIVGDYDVDGVVSSVILAEFFDDLGVSNYQVRIPNRFKDGYGLSPDMIDELDDNVSLIITVDNGISANEAAKICKEKGIDLIITDHHMPPLILPEAYAIINPKQPDCSFPNIEICGAEVAWYLVGAMKEICKLNYDMAKFLELLAIAIIADMMELRDMNRMLVKLGVIRLNSSKRAAFTAIKEFYGKDKFECDDISFLIAPLINSAGRMDDAMNSFYFLRSKNINEAYEYLDMIIEFNNSRKEEERTLFECSLKDVSENDEIIVTWGERWHEGVIGIVASRLAKHFGKPAIVFSVDKGRAKGSARSVGKLDILSLIAQHDELLNSYGGHKGAAGLVCDPENLEKFKKAINQSCFLMDDLQTFLHSDELLGDIDANEIDFELLEILESFEPYGQKNPRPVFKIRDILVKNERLIGRDQNHLKLILQKDDKTLEALFFNFNHHARAGDVIDIVFSVSKNSFRGLITPQLLIREIS